MINISLVHRVINLARSRERAERVYLDTYFPDQYLIDLSEIGHEDSKEVQDYHSCDKALLSALLALSWDDLLDLEAIMLLGRGDEEDFDAVRADLASAGFTGDHHANTAVYISSKGPLADYLEAGLRRL